MTFAVALARLCSGHRHFIKWTKLELSFGRSLLATSRSFLPGRGFEIQTKSFRCFMPLPHLCTGDETGCQRDFLNTAPVYLLILELV